jgi:sarcosine oxidase subunit beta
MSKDYDAIIIGAGIIGTCTGFELAKRGFRTLNVDKLPAAGYGSTSNTCAIIRLHYSTPAGVAMARESYFYWIDWGKYIGAYDESGYAKYINTGCLVTKTEKNHHLERVMSSLDELNVVYEELDAEGMRERLRFVDTRAYGPPVNAADPGFGQPTGGDVAGAVYIPESGYINDPQLSCHNVQRGGEARGGEYLFNAEVVEILQDSGRAEGVRLADGREIKAPIVVNVGGPHSFIINGMANGVIEGMNIKTRALKQEVCHVPAPEGIDYNALGMLISDGDIGCYSRPEVGNHILIGSEDPPCDDFEWVEDPDNYDNTFTGQWQTQVMREAQRLQGLPIPKTQQGLVDLYDVSDDWIPIYDKSDLPGFYMAVGTSGNQYKNGPVAGQMMAHLIQEVEDGHDHDADPLQFHMKFVDRDYDMGFFSRRREINPNSSFSGIG